MTDFGSTHTRRTFLAALAVTGFAVTACGSETGSGAQPAQEPAGQQTLEVEDNHGRQRVPSPPSNVVVTDNQVFQTLATWGVKLVAAPIPLLQASSPYREDKSIADLGNHREPKLESVVAVNPGLIINGGRFASKYNDIKKLVPQAPIVEFDARDGQPLDAELKRMTTALGTIFAKETEAGAINQAFDESIQQVKQAYVPAQKVLAVIVSGGKINYAAPKTGRSLGPLFDLFGFTPAVAASGSSFHEGDEIAAEAIAAAAPDLILVMDRDAAMSDADKKVPAAQLIEGSPALKQVPAVVNNRIAHMPAYTYLNEGIQTYTTYFNELAGLLKK